MQLIRTTALSRVVISVARHLGMAGYAGTLKSFPITANAPCQSISRDMRVDRVSIVIRSSNSTPAEANSSTARIVPFADDLGCVDAAHPDELTDGNAERLSEKYLSRGMRTAPNADIPIAVSACCEAILRRRWHAVHGTLPASGD